MTADDHKQKQNDKVNELNFETNDFETKLKSQTTITGKWFQVVGFKGQWFWVQVWDYTDVNGIHNDILHRRHK